MNRNTSLDAISGVAILLVIIHHVSTDVIPELPQTSGAFGFIYWFLRNIGWSGVDLFFVLSGFLIGGIIFTEIEQTSSINIPRFWLSRGFKIWPSYLMFIITAFIALHLPWIKTSNSLPGTTEFIVHFFFIQNYITFETIQKPWSSSIGPTWSLAVEEHFYLVLPLILYAIKSSLKSTVIPLLSSIILLVLCLRIYNSLSGVSIDSFKLSHFRFDALLTGVLLNHLWRHNHRLIDLIKQKKLVLLLFVFPIVSLCHFFSRNSAPMFTVGFSLLTISYAVILIISLENWGAFLKDSNISNSLANIGRSSYNIYLWHCFWPLLFSPYIASTNNALISSGFSTPAIITANILVYAAVSIAVGYFFTITIEKRFLAIRKKYIQTRFSPFGDK